MDQEAHTREDADRKTLTTLTTLTSNRPAGGRQSPSMRQRRPIGFHSNHKSVVLDAQMNRPRLTTLKPRLSTLTTNRLSTLKSPAAQRRWSGWQLQQWRKRILEKEPLCRHCDQAGRTTIATEVDHILPLSQGGDYNDANACPLCGPCHKAKTAKDMGYKPASDGRRE
jgi:5-methylcytosine-specific restriction protein A